MDWDKLRIFYAVAQAGSFTHAGKKLGLSQSAVSRQISSLEESLGSSLFHRHARGLILTEQGEILNQTAIEILSKLTKIEETILESKNSTSGPLKITLASFFGSTWLAPKLKEFHEQHPDIDITILLDDKVYNLGMREAHIAIRMHKPKNPDLIQRHLANIDSYICASSEYIEKHGKPTNISDLKNHTLIGYPENVTMPFSNPNWLIDAANIKYDNNPNVIKMNSMYAIHNAVTSGLGIAALPKYLIQKNQNIKILLKDVKCPQIEVFFVFSEELKNSKRVTIFRDFILKHIKDINN